MGKKIILLTASARPKGNTLALAAAFQEAAQKKGLEVVPIDVTSLEIGACHGCSTCYKNGMPCSFDDDFNKVAEKMNDADGVVFAYPIYWRSVPAKLKAVIDKFFSYYISGTGKGLEWAIISCCQEDNLDPFEGARVVLDDCARLLDWHFVGEVLVPGVYEPGEVKDTAAMQKAAELADAF